MGNQKLFIIILLILATNTCYGQKKSQAEQLDSIFSVLYTQNQFNGAVLVSDKGKVVFRKGYGYRNEATRKPNTPGTVFELASCSKPFTALAIVLLNRQGKIDYADKLPKYLPELSFWDNVSIYDLLRHTSGIPEYLADMRDSGKIATNNDLIRFYAERKDTLQFKPGTYHRYCNTNYALLASIIEKASGETYADFLRKNIFMPLGMKNTFVYNRRQAPRHVKNHAIGYVWAKNSFEKVTRDDSRYNDKMVYYLDGIVGNAKVNSTVDDLLKWINALKNNTFVSRKVFDQITEVTQTAKGKKIPYGFGLELSKGENKFSFGHTGNWDGYTAFVHHNMLKDRTIIILENFHQGTYSFKNINQILDNEPVVAEFNKKTALDEETMKKYSGTYVDENTDEQHLISYLNGHLIYNTPGVPWDMRFFPTSDHTFQAIRQGGVDGLMDFRVLENGSVELKMYQYGKEIGTGIKKQ